MKSGDANELVQEIRRHELILAKMYKQLEQLYSELSNN